MPKSLDGIKKLNSEDIKKYRKIVLNYIGENEKLPAAEKSANPGSAASKKVDGLNLNKTNSVTNSPVQRQATPEKASRRENSEIGSDAPRKKDNQPSFSAGTTNQPAISEQLALTKRKAIAEEASNRRKIKQAEKARRGEAALAKEKIEQEKARLDSSRRQLEEKRREAKEKLEISAKEEKRRAAEMIRLDKIKHQADLKRMAELQLKNRQIAEAEQKIRRRERRQLWKNFRIKYGLIFRQTAKHVFFLATLIFLIMAILYAIFCLTVLRLGLNNSTINRLTEFVPVPAVLTGQGIISFNDYREAQRLKFAGAEDFKSYLTKLLIRRNLSKKYRAENRLSAGSLDLLFVLDKDFNQIGLSRINKIYGLSGQGSGLDQLGKYADEYNSGHFDRQAAAEKFGQEALSLAPGQASGIIYRPEGYYLIKKLDESDYLFKVEYLFVRAYTLDQYIEHQAKEITLFILAD